MDTLKLIDQNDKRSKVELTHPTDLVKGRDYVLRVATHAVDGDHLVLDGLNIVACAEKLAKALAGHAELLLHAALDANVDGRLLFLELVAKGGDLHEVVGGLKILADGLCCGYCWCGHAGAPVRCAGRAGRAFNRRRNARAGRSHFPGPWSELVLSKICRYSHRYSTTISNHLLFASGLGSYFRRMNRLQRGHTRNK